jgi:hypothetical protein
MGWSVPFSLGEFLVEGPLLAGRSPLQPRRNRYHIQRQYRSNRWLGDYAELFV